MSGEHPTQRAARTRPALEVRSRLLLAIRRFFHGRGFVEVETPVRIPCPASEIHIDAEPSGSWYLRTSPEFHMKRLLAAGLPRVFQVGPCFRRGEFGARHHTEFSMLEWYRAGADYRGILADTVALLRFAAVEVAGGCVLRRGGECVDLAADWLEVPVADAFRRYAGWDPATAFDAARFDEDMAMRVEPALPRDRPVVLIDYPAGAAAFARLKPGRPALAERWELYVGGMELANAYSELADAAEQRGRLDDAREARRRLGRAVYPLDEPFLAAMAAGMPPAGGIALGLDRLVMLLAGAGDLDDVLPFRSDGAGA